MTDRIRVGQQRPVRMRRIGAQHMIVMPPQAAQVMSVEQIKQALRVAEQQQAATEAQLVKHRGYIADLRNQIAAFEALPIERDDDDPEVPQPELVDDDPGPRRRRAPEVRGTTLSGGSVYGLARTTTPVGFGTVPAGATPVPAPEPEVTAADA